MKKISNDKKYMLVGGYRRAVPKTKIAQAKGFFSLKNINDFSHNMGLISMTISTSASNLIDVIQEATATEQSHSFYVNNSPYSPYSNNRARMADAIRPMLRFGAYSFRNGINFGLPWA